MPKGTTYIDAKPATDQHVDSVDQALRIVRWLGSPAAADVPYRQRKAQAEALASWLVDYAEHVERVEHGCQRLLLQAAAMCGERSQSS